MTLQVLEGFDGGDIDWQTRTSSYNAVTTTATGARSGNGALINQANDRLEYLVSAHATAGVGYNAYVYAALASNSLLYFLESSTTHVYFTVTTATGAINAYNGSGSLLGSTADGVFPLSVGSQAYFEFWVTINDSTGSVQIWRNGASVLNLTGQDTRNGGTSGVVTLVRIGSVANNALHEIVVDDLYVCNGAGSTNNAGPMELRVETLLPDGNGNYSQLVGSDSDSVDNYALVDESNPSSSDYVGSATDGQKDSYTYGNMSATSGTVRGVVVASYAAKTGAAAKSMRPVARRASVDASGSDFALGTGYDTYDQVWETDPTDASAWTIANVNSSEFGAEVRP